MISFNLIDLIKNILDSARTTLRWQGSRRREENIIEHSQNMAMLCSICYALELKLNPEIAGQINYRKLIDYAIFHDILSEPLMGDIVTPLKYEEDGLNQAIGKIEDSVAQRLIDMFSELDIMYGDQFGSTISDYLSTAVPQMSKDATEYQFFKTIEILDQLYVNAKITNNPDEHIFRAVRSSPDWEKKSIKKLRNSGFKSVWRLFVRDLKNITEEIIRAKGDTSYCVEDDNSPLITVEDKTKTA